VLNDDGRLVPGIAPAAKQMGCYAASVIAARVTGRVLPGPFCYRHQGDLATIGRKAAVVKLRHLTLTGSLGWAFWGLAHVYFLIGLRNRISVAFSWAWDYVTFGRRARLITEPADARPAEAEPKGPSGQPSAAAPATGAGTGPEQGTVWG
jgi:NADH dehydrogenase